MASALLVIVAGCAEPSGAGLIRNAETRRAAAACGLPSSAVSIDPLYSQDRRTLVIPRHVAESRRYEWHCLRRWAAANDYRIGYQLVFDDHN